MEDPEEQINNKTELSWKRSVVLPPHPPVISSDF